MERRRRAETDRRVTCRPAPDVMAHLSALLPVQDGVAAYASLTKEADRLIAAGDPRSHGQIMPDTLVARVTGTQSNAGASVTVNLTISDAVLLGTEDGAGWVEGHGPVPADLARQMAADATWLRRLYLTPATGDLVTMDSAATRFPAGLAEFLRLRDRTCRSRWCDAPIRHTDHIQGRAEGGPSTADNGQGLCEACNYAKAAPGWSARPRPGPRHTVRIRTPPRAHPRLHRTTRTPPRPHLPRTTRGTRRGRAGMADQPATLAS